MINSSDFKYKGLLTHVVALILGCVLVACNQPDVKESIWVNAAKVEGKITPWLYGACIEDVNHEIYGGIYDQKIFGESFEEPVPSPVFDGFSAYEGDWSVADDVLAARAYLGAKLVYDALALNKGMVETDIKFDGDGESAGLLVAVSKPGNGADNFYGYEISLAANGKKIVLGKHKNNFTHLKDIVVNYNPQQWNRLKVALNDGTMKVYLNGKELYTLDKDPALKGGNIGLRTWNAHVKFRQLKIESERVTRALTFKSKPVKQVSRQWTAWQKGTVQATYAVEDKDAYNGQNAQMITLVSGDGHVGIANAGLNGWGIAVREGQKLKGRLYLKSPNLKGPVTLALQSHDGTINYATQELRGVANKWQQFPFELTANAADTNARLAVFISEPGKLSIDQVTLMSTRDDQFKDLPLRKDIAEAMVKQGLTFLRYGGTMVNNTGYRFKNMIGDPDRRPPYQGHWYPYSTNGFGIEDFLKFCEAAGFTASFAINIEESAQDAADMIEYLNGPVSSVWGKKRAENGHPEPYHIKYVEIGNEEVLFHGDQAEEYAHYIARFNLLHDAIKGKDPKVSLISSAWWRPESPNMEGVFKALDGKADFWDYHPWADSLSSGREVETELRKMQALFLKWNPRTTMRCAIFEENGNTHSMQRALGHVTIQNAVRRMGDFVLTSCAANALQPYLQHDSGWDQGQVFFTPSQVWGMPPYYAQQMASKYHQPLRVYSTLSDSAHQLDVTATRSENGDQLVLHVANTGADPVAVNLKIAGFDNIKQVKAITLAGALTAANTPEEPMKIAPVEQEIKPSNNQVYELAAHAYTVLVYSK